MARRFVITGTHTEIGKTIFSAGSSLCLTPNIGNRSRLAFEARPIPRR